MAETKEATPKHEPPAELPYGAQTQKALGRAKKTPDDQAEYFYNIRRMHILMFVSSALLLASLLWMFYDDTYTKRPWKHYQQAYADLELGKLESDIAELREIVRGHQGELDGLDRRLERKEKELHDPSKKLTAVIPVAAADLERFGREVKMEGWTIEPLAPEEEESARGRVRIRISGIGLSALETRMDEIKADHYGKQQTMNFDKSDYMTLRWRYEEAEQHLREAREGAPKAHAAKIHQKEKEAWEGIQAKVERSKLEFEKADWLLTQVDALASELKRPLEEIRAERARKTKELDEKIARWKREKPQFANQVRNAPVLDFFDPTIKIQQVLLDDVRDNYYFVKVGKADRCHTCHRGIDNPDYEVAVDPHAASEVDRTRFKNPFLREYVEHALGRAKDCAICKRTAEKVLSPQIAHGSWTEDDAIRYVRALAAHPRLDLYVSSASKHPLDKIGCTACHEGDGRATEFARAVHVPSSLKQLKDWKRRYHYHASHGGMPRLWDTPMLPQKHIQASCRRCHGQQVELHGANEYVRATKLYERLGCYACHRTDAYQILPKDTADPNMEPNRRHRRPGPPLKQVAGKVPAGWMYKWILNPKDFRLTTRMPRFFGQSNARTITVSADLAGRIASAGGEKQTAGAQTYPPAQVEGAIAATITEYLLAVSDRQKLGPLPNLKGDASKGRDQFEQIGCRACHTAAPDESHARRAAANDDDVYRAESGKPGWYETEFGPNLSAIGTKLGAGTSSEAQGRAWLFHWIRNPHHYFPQTRMPRMRPQDKPEMDDQDLMNIVEYLMSLQKPGWAEDARLPEPIEYDALLDYLVFEQLRLKMPHQDALDELAHLKKDPQAKRLWFGRKMVQNYGCYSCHEMRPETPDDIARLHSRTELPIDWTNIEGIGVELTGNNPEGIKAIDKLDFGYAALDELGNHRGVSFKHGFSGRPYKQIDQSIFPEDERHPELVRVPLYRHEWFHNKLLDPRVFDGGKLSSKPPDELLRMPNFYLNPEEAKLLSTFLMSLTDHDVPLGLVRDVKKRMTPDDLAIARGERLVREYNCGGCHRMQLDRFLVNYRRKNERGKDLDTNEWVEGRFSAELSKRDAAAALVAWGLLPEGATEEQITAQWVRSYAWTTDGRTMEPVPFVTDKAQYVAFDGQDVWFVEGTLSELVLKRKVKSHIPQEGGDILAPIREFKTSRGVKADALESRYPPMLRTQGAKTEPEWLFQFLKRPTPIRPALRLGRSIPADLMDFAKKASSAIDYEEEEPDLKAAVAALEKAVAELPDGPQKRALGSLLSERRSQALSDLKACENLCADLVEAVKTAELNVRMPTFGFTDEEAGSLAKYFWVRDQLPGGEPFPFTEVPERDPARWSERLGILSAMKQKVVEVDCVRCHFYDGQEPSMAAESMGPELAEVERRFRPRWLYPWLRKPGLVYPGTTMTEFWVDRTPAEARTNEDQRRAVVEFLLNYHKAKAIKTN